MSETRTSVLVVEAVRELASRRATVAVGCRGCGTPLEVLREVYAYDELPALLVLGEGSYCPDCAFEVATLLWLLCWGRFTL